MSTLRCSISQDILEDGQKPEGVTPADLTRDVSAVVDSLPREWKFAIVGQTLGRRFLLNKRCRAKANVAALANVIAEVRVSRDLATLMEGIQVCAMRRRVIAEQSYAERA